MTFGNNLPPGVEPHMIPGNEEDKVDIFVVTIVDEENSDYAVIGAFSSMEKAEKAIPPGLTELQREQFMIDVVTLDVISEDNVLINFNDLAEENTDA